MASRVSTARARSVAAMQVAERGALSRMPISPIRLPGPSTDTTMLSCAAEMEFSIVTSPSSTSAMKSFLSASPSRITTSPVLTSEGRMYVTITRASEALSSTNAPSVTSMAAALACTWALARDLTENMPPILGTCTQVP